MRNSIRRLPVWLLLAVVIVALAGCATRSYVRHQVGTIEPQVAEVRDAQAQQAERIDAVDRRVQESVSTANRGMAVAEIANDRAEFAGRRAADADRRADAAQQDARRALNRIETAESHFENRFASLDKYSVVDRKMVTFKFDSDLLDKNAISMLEDVAGLLNGTGYVVELQGFTDSTGSEKYNLALSARRAESVLRYLMSKDIPLFRISIVGLGKASPVADNATREGREQNRRVEVRVLRPGEPAATATR